MGGERVIEEIGHFTIEVLESSLLWGFLGRVGRSTSKSVVIGGAGFVAHKILIL
jgi:hypothetical protein